MSSAESAKSAATTSQTTEAPNLLDQVIAATRPQNAQEQERAKDYFKQFLDQAVKPGQVVSKDVETNIKSWIAEIDKKLSAQLNEVLHDPGLQALESTWRGLHYLVSNTETSTTLKIRVMNIKKQELFKDLARAVEFDQSSLFKKVYEEEYGQLGGQPFGMLVGDYEFGRNAEDIDLLKMISGVAAASHAPFVSAASPKLFGFDSYTEMANPRDLAKIFDAVEYAPWKSFRESEDSRYAALTLPRVLSRLPYGEKFKRVTEFNFEEQVDGTDHNNYSWMNAAWPYAVRITDAFAKYGWMARTRGVEGGGKVEGLPVHTFPTDDGDRHLRPT
jgi:type VI secretion system protein ImpC